ncbi:MAG: hypothetical protein WCK90_06330, partial [archaeon]
TLAIISLVFAIVQFKAGKNKWAVWGLVLSIIGLILSGLVFYVVILIGSRMTEMYQTIASCKIDPSLPQCAELMNALAPNLQAQLAGAGLA